MISRRKWASAATLVLSGVTTLRPSQLRAASVNAHMDVLLKKLEAGIQGRLGMYVIDTASGREYGYRCDERFMMLSSFKLLACALVLARVDQGLADLNHRIRYTKRDLVPWSPITEQHIDGQGMTLAQLCEATMTTSDNTAANLILASYGGPNALTTFARQIGDHVTRLDRNEPLLNVRTTDPAPLDTTSPRAMSKNLEQLLLGTVLSPPSRSLLQKWMRANTTGDKRLKAGLAPGWQIGDKTGTNQTDANDVGIVFPPDRAPMLVSVYLADSDAPILRKEETIAEVGRLLMQL